MCVVDSKSHFLPFIAKGVFSLCDTKEKEHDDHKGTEMVFYT